MTRQQQINSEKQLAVIMKHFDFDKVYQYMVDTDWKWYRDIEGEGTIPTLRQLRKRAKYLLTVVSEKGGCTQSGGFSARNITGSLCLSFELEAYDTDDFV
jgi:hypothetical protein